MNFATCSTQQVIWGQLLLWASLPKSFCISDTSSPISDMRGMMTDSQMPMATAKLQSHQSQTLLRKEERAFSERRPLMANLELLLPLRERDFSDYERYFDRSSKLFFPDAKLAIILDETRNKSSFAKHILQDRSNARMVRNPYADLPELARQQFIQLQADTISQSEYIGFVDADTVFITPVTEGSLFRGEKPIIIGRSGPARSEAWKKMRSTALWDNLPVLWATSEKELLNCMSYFPVIFKRAHLAEMRQFLETKHGMTLENVFYQLALFQESSTTIHAQFNILCNWLFAFKHDEYDWHIHRTDPTPSKTNHEADDMKPIVQVAQHARYDGIKTDADLATRMVAGVCKNSGIHNLPVCEFENASWLLELSNAENDLQRSLFEFENASWLWDVEGCRLAQTRHYADVTTTGWSFAKPEQVSMLQWLQKEAELMQQSRENKRLDWLKHFHEEKKRSGLENEDEFDILSA